MIKQITTIFTRNHRLPGRASAPIVPKRYMSSKVAVILGGNGVYDGSEIQEVAALLFSVSRAGYEIQCFAPDKPQHHVLDRTKGEEMKESRNVLVESSRVCRGNIKALSQLPSTVEEYACLMVPGGFGVAKNLCNHATEAQGDASKLLIEPALVESIKKFNGLKKPIGMCCIAPVIAANVLKAKVTVGSAVGERWPYSGKHTLAYTFIHSHMSLILSVLLTNL